MKYGTVFSLDGKIAVVTGAGRGLGKAMALALAEAGADVVVVARTEQEIEETKKEIIALGRKSIAITTDVTKTAEVDNMIEKTIEQFGKIDILINNAGGATPNFALNLIDEEIQRDIALNLFSTMICCRAAGQYMTKQKSGKIINISALGGEVAVPELAVYGSCKAGVEQFTRILAKEWARYNIHVNCIAPGHFYSRATERASQDEQIMSLILKKIPMRRFGQPAEIGALAVYLSSEASSFITGSIINIDGGQHVG